MTDPSSAGDAPTAGAVYDVIGERLADPATVAVATLPDGSVDSYCRVVAGGGGELATRDALAERVASGSKSIHLVRETREPGGQCVNMARQAHALGDQTVCYGFLDHPLLHELPFETVSMGPPADIRVCTFTDDDENVVFALDSEAVADWTLADLERVTSDDARDAFGADAVCVGNWVTCRGLTDALPDLAGLASQAGVGTATPNGVLVVDPGDVTGADRSELPGLLDAVADAATQAETIVSVNEPECVALGGLLDDGAGAVEAEDDALRAIYERTGAVAALHGRERAAVVAGEDARWSVPALSLGAVERRTGAGDRWSAALAHARALAWDWPTALALANACAGYYVATAETATPCRLRSFLATTGP